ncbi:MAG TPA: NAD(P)/FAD-dependent oxidoreductase [Thermoanaerobaculia bacterium]|nr:NAD(P)/FAD-dependent oxidoreductase [Thermoanaerobaculia bacterium]
MSEVYDAVVIGGGPGGSTVATALSRAGRRVILLEREKFPRFHVGESLLPFSLPILDRLGVHEKVRAAGYQKKYGAFFWNESNGTTRPVVFAQARDPNHPMAYQVKRADFDDLLLRHAASCGARVREETAVEDVLFEGGRAVGVRARPAAGGPGEEIRARVVVDASGQGAVLSRKLGLRRFDPKLKRAALFTHYEGLRWPEESRPGDILLPIDQGVWYWIIPFSDGTCSVGGVFDPAEVRFGEGTSPETRFESLIERSSRMQALLSGARRVSKVHGVSDYSAHSPRLGGDGWVLVGDAATFLDPVFSTGVFLAMATGERAANAIDRALSRRGRVDARDFRAYARQAKRMFARFRKFVYNFYDPVFFEAFTAPQPPETIRAAVVTTLAGGVERTSPAMWLWTRAMFLGVAIDRFTRRWRTA